MSVGVCVPAFVAPPASTIDNRSLTLGPSGACICVYMCEACVSHWSSSDPRALMWNPFNPCAQSVVGWGMISLYSTVILAGCSSYKATHVPEWFWGWSGLYDSICNKFCLCFGLFIYLFSHCQSPLCLGPIKAAAVFNAPFCNLYV